MKLNRKNIYSKLVIIAFLCVTIGYAAINSTLNITGKSNISKNTWDVHFDNVVVKDGSTGEIKIPTIENQTTVDFEVKLDLPGEIYEFTVDVVNSGTIDAMIDSITKTPNLTETQQKYLNYIIEYQNGEQITTKQLVKKEEFVRLKVRVEYKKNIISSDLPTNTETLNLGFTVNYQQANDTGIIVNDNGIIKAKIVSGDYDTAGSEVCITDQCFYVITSTETTVTMLAKYNLYVGSECTSYLLSTCTPYGDKATGLQDSTMVGYSSPGPGRGITTYSSDTQKGQYLNSYNGSLVQKYINEYGDYLNQLIKIEEINTIKLTELEILGCDIENKNCTNAPSWLYSTNYWSEPGTHESKQYVWGFASSGLGQYHYKSGTIGVRPVIVISKSNF